ncbi:MAG: carbohydrate ABC transporter permease [Sphaerochaeta sp.]|jgi:raffinose/stachyose/melibiose transport system permease protein|nr:carbohydrate ABC transporter permease [Sphaerochaeta sp.]MCI2128509.1 carbohydrate ABC transporter permease [Sphaerochaeta sp.]
MTAKRRAGRIIASVLILALGLCFLFPLYIMVVNSLKNRAQLYADPVALPTQPIWSNYSQAMEKMSFLRAFANSLFITAISVVLILFFSSMCAWMITRTGDRKSKNIYFLFVATMLIPFQTLMMPLVQMMKWSRQILGIPVLNTYQGIIFLYIGFGMSMAVFLFSGFVKSIPISLEEAATLDGCSVWGVFWRVVFPMLTPTTMTVIILDIIWIWNDYLLPSLVLNNKALRTIPLSTSSFFGVFTIQWNQAMAGLTLAIIPVVIFYFCAQKYIIKGVTAGAVK